MGQLSRIERDSPQGEKKFFVFYNFFIKKLLQSLMKMDIICNEVLALNNDEC
jgi:hypothetical protein